VEQHNNELAALEILVFRPLIAIEQLSPFTENCLFAARWLQPSTMPFTYKKVLMVGATSGIGKALAERMLEDKIKVIVVGRRKENLDVLVSKYGPSFCFPIVFDIAKLDDIPSFAAKIIHEHPDLDCVFLNAGIQRAHYFSKPETIDLSQINLEVTTNYLSFVHLTTAFLPHLQLLQSKTPTCIVYVTSGLALLPVPRVSNYCATKAAIHHFILPLREELRGGFPNLKVIEVFPPAVQTELHDEKHQPDLKPGLGSKMGMPLAEFIDECSAGLENGDEQIFVGEMTKANLSWEMQRQDAFKQRFEPMYRMFEGMKRS
jgi:short-subunit dehydrogenase involved in D-alanine esterification of teichoic acids